MKLIRRTEHDGDSETRHARWSFLRRLTLRGPDGAVFLDRWGIDARLFGVYLHRIAAPDPGLDLHDHPWPFVTFVLSGGYTDERAHLRDATLFASVAEGTERLPDVTWRIERGVPCDARRWRWHTVPLYTAHRIVDVRPRTWTLVVRGRKQQPWGFYLPGGWVNQYQYDYATRRPVSEVRR